MERLALETTRFIDSEGRTKKMNSRSRIGRYKIMNVKVKGVERYKLQPKTLLAILLLHGFVCFNFET